MFCAYSMLDTIESAFKWVCVSWVDIMQLRRESGMEHKERHSMLLKFIGMGAESHKGNFCKSGTDSRLDK